MKRWRTKNTATRCLAVAALAIVLAAGWAGELRAESRPPHVGTFPPAAGKQLGDTIRSEIEAAGYPLLHAEMPHRVSYPEASIQGLSPNVTSRTARQRTTSRTTGPSSEGTS